MWPEILKQWFYTMSDVISNNNHAQISLAAQVVVLMGNYTFGLINICLESKLLVWLLCFSCTDDSGELLSFFQHRPYLIRIIVQRERERLTMWENQPKACYVFRVSSVYISCPIVPVNHQDAPQCQHHSIQISFLHCQTLLEEKKFARSLHIECLIQKIMVPCWWIGLFWVGVCTFLLPWVNLIHWEWEYRNQRNTTTKKFCS